MKNVLIINGHPNKESYVHALAKSYADGVLTTDATLDTINIGELDFQSNLAHGYSKITPLEPDLVSAIDKIKKADHIVWLFPMWWYGSPAVMKGVIDRTFLPGTAFKYNGKPFPEQLFKGKSARIVVTADTPYWYNKWVMGNPAIKQLKKGTLEFSGIKPVKVSYFGPIKDSTTDSRAKWVQDVYNLGTQLR